MRYFKCAKCEINYVTENGGICKLCQREYSDYGTCIFCGVAIPENTDICPVCRESLSLIDYNKTFDEPSDVNFDE